MTAHQSHSTDDGSADAEFAGRRRSPRRTDGGRLCLDRRDRSASDRSSADTRDRDALRRANRHLRARVYTLERALDEHDRRRQAIVDQYELVLDGRRCDRRGSNCDSDGASTRVDPIGRLREAIESID